MRRISHFRMVMSSRYCRSPLPCLSLLALLLTLFAAVPARAADPQPAGAEPSYRPSSSAAPEAAPISDPARLLALTEAPAGQSVGLDEQLGAKLPLDLTFHDEDGRTVRLRDLVDKPTVIAPVYYRCPNVCHFLQGELAQVLRQLTLRAGSDFLLLSISFDESETPDLARRNRDTYLTLAGGTVPAGGWRFLTGDPAAIKGLTAAIGYRFQRVGSDFQHPVAIIVVSRDGTIIRYLHGTRILPKDLALALMEAREGHVGTTIRKMVQYCFSYDPEQKTYIFNLLRVSATVILVTLAAFLAFLLLGGKKKSKDHSA